MRVSLALVLTVVVLMMCGVVWSEDTSFTTFASGAHKSGEDGTGPFLLHKTERMRFVGGEVTAHRRMPPILELECIGGSAECAAGLVATWAECTNIGYDGTSVYWDCESDVDEELVTIADSIVLCEPYKDGDDPYVLEGSCGIKYLLDIVQEPKMVDLRTLQQLSFPAAPPGAVTELSRSWHLPRGPVSVFVGDATRLPAELFPPAVNCRMAGLNADSVAKWRCEAVLNPNLVLGKTQVACEPHPRATHPMHVVDGSCVLEYTINKGTPDHEADLPSAWGAMELSSEVFFNTARHSLRQQLQCRKPCLLGATERPKTMSCTVHGGIPDREGIRRDVSCEAPPLPPGMQLEQLEIYCEGLHGMDDPFAIPGSCSLTYGVVYIDGDDDDHEEDENEGVRSRHEL